MPKTSKRILTILIALLLVSVLFVSAQAQEEEQPTVHAVLFYSPTCPHCEDIIQNYLPSLLDQYGDQLRIVAINVHIDEGQAVFQSAAEYFEIPDERQAVPTLVINDLVMVGGGEIPAQFPTAIAETLMQGGNEWPTIPGLAELVSTVEFGGGQSGGQITTEEQTSMRAKFLLDPVANSVAVAVLIGMVASIIGVIISFTRPLPEKDFWPKWIIPLLSVLGMGVAFYLTYVETSGVEAACGPVGDCNAVQMSPYATLFGVLPVGLLGLIGYALILIAWGVYTFGPQNLRWASAIAVWGMAFFGVLFSIYLTFLEPFVIGATCMWCISSAIFQTLIFIAATGPAKRAWQEDDFDDEELEGEDTGDELKIPDDDGDDAEEIPTEPTEAEVAAEEIEEASLAKPVITSDDENETIPDTDTTTAD